MSNEALGAELLLLMDIVEGGLGPGEFASLKTYEEWRHLAEHLDFDSSRPGGNLAKLVYLYTLVLLIYQDRITADVLAKQGSLEELEELARAAGVPDPVPEPRVRWIAGSLQLDVAAAKQECAAAIVRFARSIPPPVEDTSEENQQSSQSHNWGEVALGAAVLGAVGLASYYTQKNAEAAQRQQELNSFLDGVLAVFGEGWED